VTQPATQEILHFDFIARRGPRVRWSGDGASLDFAGYFTGSNLTESIFSWLRVGRYVLTAIDTRDLPAVQASILFPSIAR